VVGPEVEVRVQVVPDIAVEAGGKFRIACSHVTPDADDLVWKRAAPLPDGSDLD
jgi:hypothetical protein